MGDDDAYSYYDYSYDYDDEEFIPGGGRPMPGGNGRPPMQGGPPQKQPQRGMPPGPGGRGAPNGGQQFKPPRTGLPSMAAPPPMGGGPMAGGPPPRAQPAPAKQFKPPRTGMPSMAAPPPMGGAPMGGPMPGRPAPRAQPGGGQQQQFKPPKMGMPSMAAPPPGGGGPPPARRTPRAQPGGGQQFKPPKMGMPSMAAPPPGRGAAPAPARRTPRNPQGGGQQQYKQPKMGMPSMAAPPPSRGGPPQVPQRGPSPPQQPQQPYQPQDRGVPPTVPQRNPNMGMQQGGMQDSDEYEYEYEYEEEYEYEYDDEDVDEGHGMARPKDMGMQAMQPSPEARGMRPNPMSMINPAALQTARSNLDEAPAPQPKVDTGQNRPFGLTSTRIQQMRGNMTKVERKYEKEPVEQRDFRGALNSNTVVAASKPNVGAVKPNWMNPNLKAGARPMTTMMQKTNVVTAAPRSNEGGGGRSKPSAAPQWRNGVMVGGAPPIISSSARRIRPRANNPPKNNGRISAKIALGRKQDPNNPNKFLTKNRVSYRIKKTATSKKNPGASRSKPTNNQYKQPAARDFSYKVKQTDMGGAKKPQYNQTQQPQYTQPANREFSYRVKQTDRDGAKKVSRRSANPDRARDPNRVSRRHRRTADPNKARDPNRVSRRRRKPNVSRTSANYNIFGAKTKAVDEPGVGKGDGCYLKFDSGNGGIVYAQWTAVGYESNEALAFFKPKTPVPRFNYRKNDGRIDLLSNTMGDFRQYAEAWTYFLAMAKEHEGTISVLDQSSKREFSLDLYGLSNNMQVGMLSTRNDINCQQYICIACLPSGSGCFRGMNSAQPTFFMDNASKEGYAVRLSE